MNTEWIKTRQTKYSAYLAVYVLVVLLVLGAINFLANRYDKTYDSTANKQFTLSDQTIKVADGLKRDIHLTLLRRFRHVWPARRSQGSAGSLCRALAQDSRGIYRSGPQTAAGQGRRLSLRRRGDGR
jgi:hypothetical protein